MMVALAIGEILDTELPYCISRNVGMSIKLKAGNLIIDNELYCSNR